MRRTASCSKRIVTVRRTTWAGGGPGAIGPLSSTSRSAWSHAGAADKFCECLLANVRRGCGRSVAIRSEPAAAPGRQSTLHNPET